MKYLLIMCSVLFAGCGSNRSEKILIKDSPKFEISDQIPGYPGLFMFKIVDKQTEKEWLVFGNSQSLVVLSDSNRSK